LGEEEVHRWLQALLVTWTLLLGNVLIVSLDKPANAPYDGRGHAELGCGNARCEAAREASET
jgi:hypothetical protein